MRSYRPAAGASVSAPPADEPLRLDRNENPYGCSLLVLESLSIADALSQPRGPLPRSLTTALSRYAHRSAAELYVCDSPEELIARVLQVVLGEGRRLLAYAPYGGLLREAAAALDLEVTPLGRDPNGRVLAERALEPELPQGAPVFLGSPNDPTGDVTAPAELVTLLRAGRTVIVEETYAEFTDRTLGILGREFPNLVSLRSFAAWAGLGGAPVSYACLDAALVRELDARWPQSRLLAPSRIAAGASLDDAAHLESGVRRIRLERARLFRRLRKLNFVQPAPSHGPFLPCEVTRGDSPTVVRLLEREGVLVHDCAADGLPGHIRISVGASEHTDRLIAAMVRISVEL